MDRNSWLSKPGYSSETNHCHNGERRVLLVDPQGRTAEGHGKNEAEAFNEAHSAYKAAQHRAGLTLQATQGRAVRPVEA